MDAPATDYQSAYQAAERLNSIPQNVNETFVVPLVRANGNPNIQAEAFVVIWHKIIEEGKLGHLFYDGTVKNLKDWLDYIYNPANHVALVVDDSGRVYHIAWLNKFSHRNGFLHHCAIGKFNRKSWPLLKKFWADMRDPDGDPVVNTLLGVTPITNSKALKLVRLLGWEILGEIPGICYIDSRDIYVPGVISYCVLNEA